MIFEKTFFEIFLFFQTNLPTFRWFNLYHGWIIFFLITRSHWNASWWWLKKKRHPLNNQLSSQYLHNHLHYSTKKIVKMIKCGSFGYNVLLQFDKIKNKWFQFSKATRLLTCVTWLSTHKKLFLSWILKKKMFHVPSGGLSCICVSTSISNKT